MHIPDGYLGPQTFLVLWLVMLPIWAIAARKVKRTLRTRQIPLLSLAAAFSFVIMMFNVPVVGGSTGHAVGATLIAILLGPWAAVIAISIALVVQAGLFGDGGITALAANCFTMAVVMPFAGYYVYRLLAGDRPSPARRLAAGGAGGYVGITAGAVVAGVLFGIQPYIAHTATGQALYAPYRLDVAVPAMALEHLAFFGPIEALVTVGVLAALARTQPELLAPRPAARPLRWLWAGLAVLLLLTPLGALAPGTAWGEWSGDQLETALGYVPGGPGRAGRRLDRGHARLLHAGRRQHARRLPAGRRRRGRARRGPLLGGGGLPGAPPRTGRPGRRRRAARPVRPRGSRPLAGAQDRRRRRTLRHRRARERGARRAARPPAAPGPAGQARDAGALRVRHEPRPLHLGAAGAGRPHRSPRGGLARPGPLVRAQGLALRRAAGVPRRAAVGPLLVHARGGRRAGRVRSPSRSPDCSASPPSCCASSRRPASPFSSCGRCAGPTCCAPSPPCASPTWWSPRWR